MTDVRSKSDISSQQVPGLAEIRRRYGTLSREVVRLGVKFTGGHMLSTYGIKTFLKIHNYNKKKLKNIFQCCLHQKHGGGQR